MEEIDFLTLISSVTNNPTFIQLVRESESARNQKNYKLSIEKMGQGWELSEKSNNIDLEEAFSFMLGFILVEAKIIDIKRAYQLDMTYKARTFIEEALETAGNNPAQVFYLTTLMEINEIVKEYDGDFEVVIQDKIAQNIVSGLSMR